MSTHAYIGKKLNDDKVRSIYVHFDGYLDGVGKMLLDNYKTEEDVDKLLDLGDLSYLGKTPVSDPELWKNSSDDESKCRSYRDRGETGVDAQEVYLDDFIQSGDYVYLFDNGEWKFRLWSGDKEDYTWAPLKDAFEKDVVEDLKEDNFEDEIQVDDASDYVDEDPIYEPEKENIDKEDYFEELSVGDKVEIHGLGEDSPWENLNGTITWIDEEDFNDEFQTITVRVNFPTENGMKEVEQNFDRRNIMKSAEAEVSNEEDTLSNSEVVDSEVEEPVEEDLELNEKLPKDLARAYRGTPEDKNLFSGRERRGGYINQGAKFDYENSTYTEITPEEAMQYKKNGEIDKLRIIIDGDLIQYRPDGYPLTHIDLSYSLRDKWFTNRNGKTIRDTQYMTPAHIFKIADKIYYTDEDTHPIGNYRAEWEDGKYHTYPLDDVEAKRINQVRDEIRDTGEHRGKDRGYGTIPYYEKRIQEYKQSINDKENDLKELDNQWENGDISKNSYEERKQSILSSINRYKEYIQNYQEDMWRVRNRKSNADAESRYALSRKNLQQRMEKYSELKSKLNDAEWELKDLKKNGLSNYQLHGGSYEEKTKELDKLKAELEELQKKIAKLESEATDSLKQANEQQNQAELNKAEQAVNDIQQEIKDLLRK